MFCPSRTPYRKYQKGKKSLQKTYKFNDLLQFGRYGIKVQTSGILKSNTLEAVRRLLTRKLKRKGQIWIRVFPDKVKSQKPLGTRMGKGKGSPSYWYANVFAGQVIFELDGVPVSLAKTAYQQAAKKLPFNCKFLVSPVTFRPTSLQTTVKFLRSFSI